MELVDILTYVDHTLLATTAVWKDIQTVIDDALAASCSSVCIPPSFVKRSVDYAAGRIPVCTVIGFPNGYHTTEAKVSEAKDAIANGATELDMVINLGDVKDGRFASILAEIKALKAVCGDLILKVIVETSQLTEDEKIRLCQIVSEAGADFIKTSTGFGGGGATVEDVSLFKKHCSEKVQIKASGGIRSKEDAENLIGAGATRLGTSRLVALHKESQ
ncbi:MAG TPA: deoxyribose-phosphate aldolase [Fastidiosipila sp.]|nr:deoxyribose-phosphate aldolase [Fastidiosipila sp.]